MKRGMLLFALLVAWSLATPVGMPPGATASVIGGPQLGDADVATGQQVLDVNSAADDGSDGDPGDAGDGYGVADDRFSFDPQGVDGVSWDWEEALRLLLLVLKIAG